MGWSLKSLVGIAFIFGLLNIPSASALPRIKMYDPLLDDAMSESHDSLTEILKSLFPWLPVETAAEGWFDQTLNPEDPADSRTFKQRFYKYSGHSRGVGAPVVLYVGGESELTARSFMGRFTQEVARSVQGHLLALEHRYYGESLPFTDLTSENLKYLSTENALSDLIRFQEFAIREWGLSGKWIVIGGSYPGSLAAYLRQQHPDQVAGALASSAPVRAKNLFVDYDAHTAMVLGKTCAARLREVAAAAEKAIDEGRAQQFKEAFDAEEVKDDRDFLYVLADAAAFAVQYGRPKPLCDALEVGKHDLVGTYGRYVIELLAQLGMNAYEFSPAVAERVQVDSSSNMRQWFYQSCKEYGYWQVAHSERLRSHRSTRIDLPYHEELCRRLFGDSSLADEAAHNSRYAEPLLNAATASKIFLTNGSTDPWINLSISPEEAKEKNDQIESVVIDGGSHCTDLRGRSLQDSESLKQARDQFLQLAVQWAE
jgi:pimeloyl-ACP methyl ester carboxylesterase